MVLYSIRRLTSHNQSIIRNSTMCYFSDCYRIGIRHKRGMLWVFYISEILNNLRNFLFQLQPSLFIYLNYLASL